ncbi:MAG TPA: hypothetical protein VKU01_02745, partial [Bryobacteraceae bacterium]|nr:hypothetical protein [Bryobacteraceae bacterium]
QLFNAVTGTLQGAHVPKFKIGWPGKLAVPERGFELGTKLRANLRGFFRRAGMVNSRQCGCGPVLDFIEYRLLI